MKTLVVIIGSHLHIEDESKKNVHMKCKDKILFNLKKFLNSEAIIYYDLTENFPDQTELENSVMLADLLIVIDDDLQSPEIIRLIASRLDAGDRTIFVSHGTQTSEILNKFSHCAERQEDMFVLASKIKKIFSGIS